MFNYSFKVQYVDIDSNGTLSDYGLLKNLQEIACLHADSLGFGLKDTPQNRLAWIILNWKIKFIYRPAWNSNLNVKTWVSYMDNISCNRDFEITDDNGKQIAIVTSKWVLLDIDTHHIAKITSEAQAAFEPICDSLFDVKPYKIKEPLYYDSSFEYTILKRDIDTNKHLNNINYVMLAKETLPVDDIFSNIEVMYKHQCVLGDKIVFLCHEENNEYLVSVKNADTDVLHAIVKFAK